MTVRRRHKGEELTEACLHAASARRKALCRLALQSSVSACAVLAAFPAPADQKIGCSASNPVTCNISSGTYTYRAYAALYGSQGDDDNKNGVASDSLSVTNNGTFVLGTASGLAFTYGVIAAIARGGFGKDEGYGGSGGTVTFTNNGAITADLSAIAFPPLFFGIEALSIGGEGDQDNNNNNSNGGMGGAGKSVTVTNNQKLTFTGTSQSGFYGIYAGSFGGRGGEQNDSVSGNQKGGTGGNGGTVKADNHGIILLGTSSARMQAPANGGAMVAISEGGAGGADNGSGGSGGLAGVTNDGSVQIYWNDSDGKGTSLIGIGATAAGGGGLESHDPSDPGGAGGQGGNANASSSGQILVDVTNGNSLVGAALAAESLGGKGGKGPSTNHPGGNGGAAGEASVQLNGSATLTTRGDTTYGILAHSIGGTGGDGGSGGGLLGDAGGAGYGGNADTVSVTTSVGTNIKTTGNHSAGIAAQSIGGGGGTGGDFVGVLGGSGGDGGRGGDAGEVILTAAGTVATEGDHAFGLLAQAIGGGGGAGGIASGVLALGGDGSAGGMTDSVTVHNSGTVTTMGYGSHAIVAQSTSGGGGAAGVAGGVVAIGGDGAGSYLADGSQVMVTQTGRVSTAGDAAVGVAAQSIGGGGGAGAGADGIYSIGGRGQSGGAGGEIDVHMDGGSVDTAGRFSHAVAAQSIGGGGGSGGDVIDFSALIPTVGIGGSAGAGGAGGSVAVEISSAASLSTRGDHANGIMAQSIGGGGGSGGNATGYGGLSLIDLTIGGAGGTSGGNSAEVLNGGGNVTVTVPGTLEQPGGVRVATQGSHSIGVLAQSLGGGGGDGGNAYGFDASFNFAASVAVGGKAGGGGSGGAATVNWQNSTVTTGSDLRTRAVAGEPIQITDQASNAYGIVAQSLGGGGGTGGSATVDQIVLSVPGPIPTINLSSAVGATGGDGGNGDAAGITVGAGEVVTYGAGAHAVLAQSVGGGGGTGGDGTALGISAAIPATAKLPAINLSASLGGRGGVSGRAGSATVIQGKTATSKTTIATFGDNANAVVAQAIGGGGGDAGVGSSATFSPGEVTSLSMSLGLGGVGAGGGAGGEAEVVLGPLAQIQTVGSSSHGIVAQSIGGGGGTSQGGTAALYAGPFIGAVDVGRLGGSGGDGRAVAVDNEGIIMTYGGDGGGILAQSIGGGGGLGGTFGADGSLDDPNWVDFVLDAKHEVEQFEEGAVSYTMTVAVGGKGGSGGNGGQVDIANAGQIRTVGDWADGIVAQSIGGGGGVGGTAVAGGSEQTVSVTIGVGGKGGVGGNGGAVNINEVGTISTQGYSAFGLLAQSIGGGGGQGGDGSNKAIGTITVGGGIGGDAGSGADGGEVQVLSGGVVSTAGDGAHAVVLQSIGGGGGVGGIGNSQSATLFQNGAFTVDVGGAGGGSGAGKPVVVDLDNVAPSTIDITTTGDRAFGLVAQSVGGGGGIGGGISSAGTRNSIMSVAVGGKGGTGNLDGGEVSLSLGDSNITTSGAGSHAIVAQSIGGGGGIGGDASGTPFNLDGPNSTGNIGDGNDVSIVSTGTISTTGDYAFGILAQSIGGGGGFGGDQHATFAGSNGSTDPNAVSGDLAVTAYNVAATGENSVGIFAQSDSGQNSGTISIDIAGKVVGGSGQQGSGVLVAGGTNNVVTVGAGGSLSANSGTAIRYHGSSDTADGSLLTINNYGTLAGNILLSNTDASCTGSAGSFQGCAAGTVNNYSSNTLIGASLYQADVMNQGRLVVGHSGATDGTEVTGNFTQGAAGSMVVDADFDSRRADRLLVRGDAALGGTLNLQAISLRPGRELTVLTVDGAATGAFTPETSPIYRFALAPKGHDYHLSVVAADFDAESMRLQVDQSKVAGSLQDIWDAGGGSFGALFGALHSLADRNAGSYGAALSDISPGISGAAAAGSIVTTQQHLDLLLNCPMFSAGTSFLAETECGWAQAGAQTLDQNTKGDVSGFDITTYALQAGAQVEVSPNWFVGFAGGYDRSSLRGDDGRVNADGDILYAGVSLKHQNGPWLLSGAVGGSYGWYDNTRTVRIPGFAGQAQADPHIYNVSARMQAAYTFAQDPYYVRPLVDLDLIYTHAEGYRESGLGALDLMVHGADQWSIHATPAVEVGTHVKVSETTVMRAFAAAGVSFSSADSWDTSARLAHAPAGTGTFDSEVPLADVVGRLTAGVDLANDNDFSVRLQYSGSFSDTYTSHGGSLRLSYKF